nr:hypothetical protein [Gottfriedia luciferensis]
MNKGELSLWENEYLELPIHEIHGSTHESNSELEVLLNEIENNEWRFRRDVSITCGLDSFFSISTQGIPYLNPEIVLLYKVKNTREKDRHDFDYVKNSLEKSRKTWLREAILRHHPDHEWLQDLS